MDMSGKTVIVAGLGVSGQSMMEVLGSRAEKVLGVDEKKPDADLHSFDRIDWDHVDLVMTSPVFNPRTPFILEAQRRGIPVMSEVELAWQLRVNCDSTGEPAQWIGITGTNGKTSSTYLLKTVLEKTLSAKVGLIGTIQNMIGDEIIETERTTPESFELQKLFYEMKQAGCTHVVMEVSSHSLVLDRVAGIHFQVGVFTNLTQDHLDFHKTMEEYRKAKAILFRRCDIGVFNGDDAATEKILETATCKAMTYGETPEDDLWAEHPVLHSDGVEFTAKYGQESAHIRLGIPGKFTVYNALGVLGAAIALGVPLEQAVRALETAKGVKGRVEVVPTPGEDYTILIDYAHAPDGLENVLSSVRGFCKGRLISVFGCGGDRDTTKRPIMGEIGARLSDIAIITSDNPRTEDPNKIIDMILAGIPDKKNCLVEENRRKAIRMAMELARKDDIIVLCGKGHETYQIIGTEKTHLDEREEVAAHLREKKGM